MTQLTLRLFGPGVLTADGAVVRTHSARTLALLGYLVLEPGRRHARAMLADLWWPERPEASGRQSLRQALYSLRTLAGGRLNDCLKIDPQWVMFEEPSSDSSIDIDVYRFLAAVRSPREADWLAAAQIQKAPLLDGLVAVPDHDSAAWLVAARERLRALAMQNLGRLVVGHMTRNDWEQAAFHASAMCELDPTSEVASLHLLRAHAAQGQGHAADAECARLRSRLAQSLGVDASAEYLALHRTLRQQGTRPSPTGPTTGSEALETPSSPTHPHRAREAEAMVWAGQAAERVYAFSQAADLYDRALRVLTRDRAAPARRVDVLLRREATLERLGRRAEQAAVIDEAMSIAQDLGDPARIAAVCLRRAGAGAYQWRHDDACAAAEQALRIFRELGDAPGEAEALRELGFVHWHADHHAQALVRTREALDLHRRIGDLTGEATALHNLAEIYRGLGSPGQASQWFEQAMRLHWAARNPVGEILSLFGWSQAQRQLGDLAGSTEKLKTALQVSEAHGERVMHSRVLHALSTQQTLQGALDSAVDFMRRAIDVDRSIGYSHALGHDLVDLSNLHLLMGDVAQARVAMLEALVWFGFNEDSEATASTRARLIALDTRGAASVLSMGGRGGVKSHLALGEGKVYCEFESPLGQARRRAA